jgi:hypothetical protein
MSIPLIDKERAVNDPAPKVTIRYPKNAVITEKLKITTKKRINILSPQSYF